MSQRGSVRKRGETWTCYWFVRGPGGQRVQKSKVALDLRESTMASYRDIAEGWIVPGLGGHLLAHVSSH